MKVWLDDEREAPVGWLHVKRAEWAILLLETELVDEISLDHDLGTEKNGYDVVQWIEAQVVVNDFVAPEIHVHSQNPVGFRRITAAIEAIKRWIKRKGGRVV